MTRALLIDQMLRYYQIVNASHFDRRIFAMGVVALPLVGCEKPVSQQQPKPVVAADPNGLVELTTLDPSIRLDIRYATASNFTGRQLYTQARAFLIRPAAEALLRAHRAAQSQGFGLTVYDAYRPWRVTKALWDATPPGPKRNYVANPKRGSKHNRGRAVDLTLHDLETGVQVAMPSGYDEFTPRAHRNFAGAPTQALANRDLLESLMERQGFRGASNEWWHFDFAGWDDYPILDIPFEDLAV
jgi:zinc D-Ala-D-Ala dipeptidase